MKDALKVQLVRLPHAEGIALPQYQTGAAAGFDIAAACPADEPIRLQPMQRALVPTGWIFELPAGYEGQVRPRSGLALKHGITCLNTPGTIDADYRGEVMVLLINLGEHEFVIERGMRIAQMIIAPVTQADLVEVELSGVEQTPGSRGSGGFGSTGV